MAERNIFTQNNTQQDENSYENKGIFAGFTPVGKQESTGLYSPSQIQSTQVGSNGEVYNLPEYTLPSLAEVVEANSEKTWDITNAVNSRFGNFVRSAYQSAEAKDDLKSWEFASILSDIANVDIQFAKDNSKAIIQTFTGRDIDESTFATGLWNSFLSRFVSDYASTRATLFNATLGGMTERQRQIAIDNFVSNELHKMSSYWNPDMYGYKDSVLGKIAYFTAENLPSVIESQLLGLGFGAIGGVVASASAKSAINVLYNITRTASVFTKEAGSTLLSLYQTTDASGNRMSYEAITQASTMVGLVNTAFEFGLEKVLDTVGVKTMSALSRNVFKKFGKMSAKEISDTAIQTTAQYLKKGIKGNFLNALGEGTTEAMQTWSEDFFTNLAYKKSEGFGDYVKSNKDILKDMAETFAYTAASTFLEAPFLLGGGDDSFTFAGYLKNTRTGQVVSVKQARNYSTKTNDSTLVSTRNLNTYTNSKQTQYEQSSQGSEQSLKGNEETNRANRNARVYKIGTQYVPATVEDSNIIASYKDKTVAVYVDVVKDAKVEGTSLDLTSFKTQQKVIGELQGNVTKDLIIVSDKSFNDSLISLIKNNDVISIVFEKDGQVVDGNTGSYDKATLSIASDTGEINNFSIVNETYAKNNSITDFEAIEVSEVREDQQLRETALQNETNDRVKQYKKLTEKEMDSVFQETKKNYNKTTKGYLNKFQKNVQEKMFTLYKGQPNAKKNAKAISYAVTDLMARFAQINNTDVKTYIEARLGNVENSFINIMTEEDASKAQTRAFIERNADNTWTINLFNTPNSQTDIVHEFSHMFLSTLEDESVIDDFKRLYAEEFADGGILGAKFQEKFSNDLVNYMASGKVRDSKLKAVFDTILTALNNFAQFIRGMDFSQKTEVWQAFDKLFDTTKQAQERESQGQRLNNLASAIDKIDSTKLNSERLEDNELTSLLDDTKTFIEMIKSNELSNDEKAQAYDELYNTLEALKEGLLVLGSNDSQVENLLNQLGDEELSSLMANRPTSSLMYRKENSGLVFENKNGIINTGNNKSSEGFDEYAEQRIEYDGESGYETDDNSNRANDNRGLQADSQGQMRVSERHQYAMGLSTAGLQGTARRFEGNELRRGAGNYVGRPLANAKLTNLIKTKFNKKEVSDVAFVQLDKTVANMQYFSDKLEKARTGKFGYFVDGKSVEELMNPKTEVYLSDDGKTGFVIERDYHGHEGVNNIAGVFNYSEDGVKPKNGVVSVLINAIQQGGNALDCFADGLETMYAQIGFVPYAKNPFAVEYAIGDENWERDYLSKNKELPSVMAMYFAYNDINDYARNMKNIDIVSLFENVPIADDYDKMLDSRDEFVQQQKNNQQVAETNADPNIYTKNIDFIRDSETSVLVPYTTEQMVGRIRVGKPVDTSDIQTLLETDKNMTSYQRSVLTKEIEAIRTLTANPILYNTILDKYSQTKDYNLTYDEVMKAMKELDSNFKFESKRAGLELIKRAIAHSSWNTTESLNINFISSIKTNADLDSLALDLKRKGYLDKELVNRPVTSLRRIAESLEKRRTISEATYENARKEIADSLNTTLLRVAFNGGISYEDSNNVYNSDTVSINAKEFANTIYNADLPEEYRKALENGAYNDTLLAEITNYIQGQENKTREQESANASLAKENETLTQTLNDTQEQYLADLQLATSEINDYKAQINSLNQSLETLKTDLENKKIKLEDYKKIEAKLKTDLRTANAKYAMYMGEKKSREINEKIKKTSTLNREIQDHTTGRDLQLLYGDLNIKKDILEKSNGIKMNSDVKTYFPSLYTWLEDKGIIANDKIYGNLGDLTVEERTELLEHLKDYRNLTKSILSQRNSDKANKASSDAIIMKRDMRLGDYKLTQEQEDNIQLQIDKTIAQKRQNNEVIEDEQAYRNTLYLDLASKTLLGQAKAESRPGNREYRKKNTEGLFKSIRLSWDIPRNILKSMGKGIERLVLGGYDESGNEVIGAEQLTSDKLRAVDKRLKGLETAIIETFGDNLKKKGKVSKFDMLNIFALDTSKLEDTQFKMFEFKPKLQDDGSISYEYSPTEKMKEYIKSTDPMIARVSQSLYELAVRQDMAGFDNSEEIFNYTIENKMAIYTLAKQSYALNTLWQSNNLRASQIFRIFSDFVDAEKGTKYNKAKRLADWIQVDAESRFNEINNISIKLDNKDLTDVKVLDYFGLLFDNSPMYEALKITLNPEANTQEQNYMLANGFLQDRTGNRKQLKLDLLSSWEKQIQRQEHYIAFAEYFDNMKRIMVDNGLFEDIKRTQGEKTASWLNSFFRDISNASHKVEDSAEIVTKSFGWMRSNLAKAALAWNISPILTQPATLAYAINEGVPLSYLFSAMRSVASKDTKAMIYELSPQMKKQSKAEINLAKATGKDMAYMSNRGKAQRYIDIVSEVGMKPMELADTYVKNTLWLAKYNQSYDNYIKEGFDSSYSSKRAGYDADVFVMDSQSNTSAKNTPAVYRSKNDLVRLALMFTSQSNKQFWYLANNISNMEVGKRIGIIARNMVGISMAIALTSLAHGKMIPKKDEDIEEWLTRLMKEYAGETLSTIPIAGQLVSQYQYGSSSGISLPVADVFQDAYNFTYTLFDEEKTSDTRTKGEKLVTATKNLMLDIAGSFGMPKQAVKKVYNAIVDENLLKALGYDWGELIE